VRALEELFRHTAASINREAMCVVDANKGWALKFPTPFSRLAMDYVRDCPSCEVTLERLGVGFSEWLQRHSPQNSLTYGLLLEDYASLARFEFASWEVAVAPNVGSIDVTRAQQPGFEHSTLWCSPHVRHSVLPQRWLNLASPKLAELHCKHRSPTDTSAVEVVTWREEFRVRHALISSVEYSALSTAMRGVSIQELCVLLHQGGDAKFIHQTLTTWLVRGWVTRLEQL
jgi:hypothetical protein